MSEVPRKRLIFEGWRFIPHSSAIVLQSYCLAAARRADIEIKVRELPFNGPWSRIGGMFPEALDRVLQGLPTADEGEVADVVVRIGSPIDLAPAAGAAKTFVMAAPGAGSTVNLPIADGLSVPEALASNPTTRLLTPSAFARIGLVAQGVPETRIDVVPRGVDPGFFRPPSDSERENLRERFGWVDEFVFLHVGAMTDNKGIDRLLQAFSMVVAQYPQARLVLKGVDSIYRSKDRLTGVMRSLTPDAAAAVEARKTYIGGNYKLVDMTRLYQCADAFVAPYVSEAFCSPALEAAACGLPSICTQGGPTEEFTTDEFSLRIGARWDAQARILVPDVNHLAQNMVFILTNTAWKERAKIVAADFAARRFSWIQATDHLLRTVGL
ncbi:MAG: glycosyltransferase family 4 protein [Pseudomonadota bacterium]|nr:glycosyltransferase family 4 protein [Pseudomonadota bacterium]